MTASSSGDKPITPISFGDCIDAVDKELAHMVDRRAAVRMVPPPPLVLVCLLRCERCACRWEHHAPEGSDPFEWATSCPRCHTGDMVMRRRPTAAEVKAAGIDKPPEE